MVLEGESAVDEAMLTGESVPADKKSGSELFAGTVNLNGRLVMRVTATGEATALAHIIAAVQRAQTSRADIQRLGDRISNVSCRSSSCIALAAGIFWAIHSGAEKAFVIAAGVLIVACPCAMGLATPAAIMASANAAARRGILIRDGVALEKAGKITAVIFDKTGTLTIGKPEVAAWNAAGRKFDSPASQKSGARRSARHSTHPVSQAIAKISAEKIECPTGRKFAVRRGSANSKFNIQRPTFRRCASVRCAGCGNPAWTWRRAKNLLPNGRGRAQRLSAWRRKITLLGLFAVRDALKAKCGESGRETPAAGTKNISRSPATIH